MKINTKTQRQGDNNYYFVHLGAVLCGKKIKHEDTKENFYIELLIDALSGNEENREDAKKGSE